MNERILITGGTGFIGTHLVNRLVAMGALDSGIRIEIVDDLSSSTITPERLSFFKRHEILFHHQTVEEFQCSTKVKYREIYHLACRVGPAHVTRFAGRMGQEIIADAMKMAELAIRDRAPLISVSTSEVYGRDPEGKPQSEQSPLEVPSPANFSPRLEYTIGKLQTELSLINLATVEPLRVNFIRPFNIVGPFQTAEGGFVLPRFVEAALEGNPLTVFGDGTQIRAFTHVSDLVESLISIMQSDVNRKVYNVGTPQNTVTIMELAERVIALLGSESPVELVDPQNIFGKLYTNAPSKIPDVSLIERELGWTPEWTLDQIIEDYARYVVERDSILSEAVAAA